MRLEELVDVGAAARVGARKELEGSVVHACLGGGGVEDDAVAVDGHVQEGLVRGDVEHAFCPVRGRLVADGKAGGGGRGGDAGGGGGERDAAAAGGRGPEQGKRCLHFVGLSLLLSSDLFTLWQ